MKARNFALTLIAASAMFAFACDDSDSDSCVMGQDVPVCVDATTVKVCFNGEWRNQDCPNTHPTCDKGACVPKKDDVIIGEECKTDSVTCVGNQLVTCVKGKKEVTKTCEYGCENNACKDKPADNGDVKAWQCDPALEKDYKVGDDVPTPYKYCCSTLHTNKAWAATDEKIALWDCPAGCREDKKTEGNMYCDRGTPTESHMCDPAKEATYEVGAPVPVPYTWCCSNTDNKKAWAGKTVHELWSCPGGCVEDPKKPGKMLCIEDGGGTGDGCAKTIPAKDSSLLGTPCDQNLNDGVCLDKYTWMYCSSSEGVYVPKYCANDCASDAAVSCGHAACTPTFTTKSHDGDACEDTYEGSCSADLKTGEYCSYNKEKKARHVLTISCNEGYECQNVNGRIGCGPAA